MRSLVVGSRGSQLALRQTQSVVERLEKLHTGLLCRIEVIRTTGDRVHNLPLAKIGDKGVFVKEIEQALLDGKIDLAVHSAKDLPSLMDPALCIVAYPERETPADALVSRFGKLVDLPSGARVGTSSMRRRAQLLHFRPDLNIVDMRGNLDTRLAKLERGEYDAIVLAYAGLARMGQQSWATEVLSYDICLPAVAQGALAVQCRTDDPVGELLRPLDDADARACVTAERAFLAGLNAGCQTPVAALAIRQGDQIKLEGLVAAKNGSRVVRHSETGDASEPEALGRRLADWFLKSPAAELLQEARDSSVIRRMGAA